MLPSLPSFTGFYLLLLSIGFWCPIGFTGLCLVLLVLPSFTIFYSRLLDLSWCLLGYYLVLLGLLGVFLGFN